MGPFRSVAFIAVALAIRPELAPSQAAPAPQVAHSFRDRLLGIYDAQSGEPIEGVRIVDVARKVTALTTSTGTVTLRFLPEGTTLLHIEKLGYGQSSLAVQISPTDTAPLTLILTQLPHSLPAVVTSDSGPRYFSPGLKQFEERRRAGIGGHFLAEADLRKHDNGKMADVIRRLPGLEIICPKTGTRKGECYASSTHGGRSGNNSNLCPVTLYIDGSPFLDNDLQKVNVNQFAGVEYYAGAATIPLQYNRRDTMCGALLLWTRER